MVIVSASTTRKGVH